MKAIQSVIYAFSGINIFAKATASSMKSTSKSAKDTSKSLSSVHSEINNVSEKDSSNENGDISPNIDLSQVDGKMNGFAQKLYDFFKPLVDSWNTYGTGLIEQVKTTAGQVLGLITSVWGSFENIITDGTVYSILENILAIIGNIAEAFSNAWNFNGNGDTIIQNIASMLNSVLDVVKEIANSDGFQTFLNGTTSLFRGLSEVIKPVIEDLTALLKPITEIALSTVGTILNSIGDALQWIGNNEVAITILESLAIAIGVVKIATSLFNKEKMKETAILIANAAAWIVANAPIILITALITALIAVIILCIKHWDEIKETVKNVCESIGEFFSNLWQGICDIFSGIGQWFSDRFNEAVQGIKNAFSEVGNFFSGVWQGICNVFGNVTKWFKDKFSQAWQAVKNVFSKGGQVFDGIKDGILNGLKTVINAIIKGINKVIAIPFNGLNTALKKIRDVSIFDFKPFSWISTLSVPQIPQLAKGGVLYDESIVKVAEYSGAGSNPEIVTPQNIMYETMRRAVSDSDIRNDSDKPIYLTVNVGNTKLGQILLDNLRDMKRQTGKDIEALVGG